MCAENVTLPGRSLQCCLCSSWVHIKCSLLSFSRLRTFDSSHSWSFSPCYVPAFFGDPTPTSTVTSSSDSSSWYTSTAQSGPSGPLLLMQHSHITVAFKPLILIPSILYLLPLHSHHRFMILAVSLYFMLLLPLPDSFRVLQWNAGGLRARSTELLHFTSYHTVDLFVSRNLTFIYLRLSGSLDSLPCDLIAATPGLVFFSDVTDASDGVIILVRQGLYFSKLSTSSLSSLDPFSDYVEVIISLNDSSSLSFLNVCAPPILSSPKDSRTNFFSPSILSSFPNLFILGDFDCHHPLLGLKKYFRSLWGESVRLGHIL